MCAAFQANKCKYPVSGSVWFQPEQISVVTDSVPEQWRPDRMITRRQYCVVQPTEYDLALL